MIPNGDDYDRNGNWGQEDVDNFILVVMTVHGDSRGPGDWLKINKRSGELEKDSTELVWCAWKEGGSRNLETRWSLGEMQVEKMT